MLYSIAELIIVCLIVSWIFKQIKLPGFVGILVVGVVFGPYVLGLIEPELLEISSELRLAGLVVILLRAGFEINKQTLKKVGRTALILSIIPTVFEIGVITLIAPKLLNISYFEAAILGTILGAVSPAVVVLMMIDLINKRKGTKKGIPTLMITTASLNDVFVILVYSIFIGIYTGTQANLIWEIAGIPISIILSVFVGVLIGFALIKLFDKINTRATNKTLIIMAISVLLLQFQTLIENWMPFAALISIISIGYIIFNKRKNYSKEISLKLAKIWILAEIVLFAMVGTEVDVNVALQSSYIGLIIILSGLIARSLGTYLCLIKQDYNFKEKMFIVISYLPKATVQAAIGAAPLVVMKANGMLTYPGEVILAIAVLSIIITAPIGAWAISFTGQKWLDGE